MQRDRGIRPSHGATASGTNSVLVVLADQALFDGSDRPQEAPDRRQLIVYAPISMPAPTNRTAAKDGATLLMVSPTASMAIEKQSSRPLSECVCWVLLSNLPGENVESAIEKVRRHAQRWNVESSRKILEPIEWKLLHRKPHKGTRAPREAPYVREAFIGIARLGGCLNRPSDPDPGFISLWRGRELRLSDIVDDYREYSWVARRRSVNLQLISHVPARGKRRAPRGDHRTTDVTG